MSLERKVIDKIKEKAKITRRLGIEPEVFPSSPLGVARILGLRDKGIVVGTNDKSRLPQNANWIYGTTDFANPVEAIMIAAASKGLAPEKMIYITDPNAHSVKSYMERILIPSLAATIKIEPESLEDVLNQVKELPESTNLPIDFLYQSFSCSVIKDYLSHLQNIVGSQETFTDLYHALNNKLSDNLGVSHKTADELYKDTQLTIGDLQDGAKHIESEVKDYEESLRANLENTASTALEEIALQIPDGISDENKTSIAKELVNDVYKFILGGNSLWGPESRKFLKYNYGNEEFIDLTSLKPATKLHELRNQRISLGGNGWIVLMQLLEKSTSQPTVIAHKATRLGANYATPLLAAKNTYACISPIIRVVPELGQSLGGDGLDIGNYFISPKLTQKVLEIFEYPQPEFQSGKKKIVMEISGGGLVTDSYKYKTFVEPVDSNNVASRKEITI